ncbi:MAG: hypothetical protein WAO19_10960 [Candidatus Kryptoniota bacterium]
MRILYFGEMGDVVNNFTAWSRIIAKVFMLNTKLTEGVDRKLADKDSLRLFWKNALGMSKSFALESQAGILFVSQSILNELIDI